MKILRTTAIILVGLSLSTPAAFACEPSTPAVFEWIYRMIHPQPDIDRGGHDSRGNHGNGGRDCSHGSGGSGGSTSTGSGSSSGGGSTSPKS